VAAMAGKLVFPFTTVATHLPAERRRRSPVPAVYNPMVLSCAAAPRSPRAGQHARTAQVF